jgi:hypothetical protein
MADARAQAKLITDTAEADRRTAAAEAQRILDEANRAAEAELATAAEQTAWSKQSVGDLIAAAEAEAKLTREKAAADAVELVRRKRAHLRKVVGRSTSRLKDTQTAIAEENAELTARAEAALAAANQEAEKVRARAQARADKLTAAAEAQANDIVVRASRREAEAQASTQVLRERAASDLAQAQRQSHDLIRKARADAQQLEAQAREHADDLRAQARKLLAEAEARVAALNQRRDEITKELTQLSGVIEALAVPGFRPNGGMSGNDGSTGESG